jgi:hypothetical protein
VLSSSPDQTLSPLIVRTKHSQHSCQSAICTKNRRNKYSSNDRKTKVSRTDSFHNLADVSGQMRGFFLRLISPGGSDATLQNRLGPEAAWKSSSLRRAQVAPLADMPAWKISWSMPSQSVLESYWLGNSEVACCSLNPERGSLSANPS